MMTRRLHIFIICCCIGLAYIPWFAAGFAWGRKQIQAIAAQWCICPGHFAVNQQQAVQTRERILAQVAREGDWGPQPISHSPGWGT
jgi:hypothetical protein